MIAEWASFVVVLLAAGVVLHGCRNRLGAHLMTWVWVGFLLRVLGALTRFEVARSVYESQGDAGLYYGTGLGYAASLWQGDLSFLAREHWWDGRLWGTQSVCYLSGLVLALIGPGLRGEALLFSVLGYAGLLLLVKALSRGASAASTRSYLICLCLLPSLWYWPSTVGKDALMLLALGLCLAAYNRHPGTAGTLVQLLSGLALALAIRPHVGAVLAGSLTLAEVLRPRSGSILRRVLLLTTGAVLVYATCRVFRVDLLDPTAILEFFQSRSHRTQTGSSTITRPLTTGPLAVPLALINTLFRPFPWECRDLRWLAASLEVATLWALFLWRWRLVRAALSGWREEPLVRLAVPALMVSSVGFGLGLTNLALICRQRTVLLPLILLLAHVAHRECPSATATTSHQPTHPLSRRDQSEPSTQHERPMSHPVQSPEVKHSEGEHGQPG